MLWIAKGNPTPASYLLNFAAAVCVMVIANYHANFALAASLFSL